jgi:hypothetical protein
VEVYIVPRFFTLTLDGSVWLASHTGRFTPGTHYYDRMNIRHSFQIKKENLMESYLPVCR